jgi:hypothetical protein
MYVVPEISQSKLSVNLLQSSGLSILFPSFPETQCIITTNSGDTLISYRNKTINLNYVSINDLIKLYELYCSSNAIIDMLEMNNVIPEAYLQAWAIRIKREQVLLKSKKLSKIQIKELITKVFHLHKSLDHLHFTAMATAIRDGYFFNTDLTYQDIMLIGNHVDCAACAMAKWPKLSSPLGSGIRPIIPFSAVSIDTLGPYTPRTVNGHSYAFILICLVTGFGIAHVLKEKPNAQDYIEFIEKSMKFANKYGW